MKNNGINIVATNVANIIPPKTPVPILRRAAAPAPVAITNGTIPNTNAIDVMTIGLKRILAASSAACATGIPSSIFWLANSTIKIAFFAANPTNVIKPIWK